jgi:hypothetical protein
MAISTENSPAAADGDLRPAPQPDDTTKFFWDAAANGRLVLQRCASCHRLQYPPDVVCTYCQSDQLDHAELSGRGTLYSFAVVDRAFHPGFVSCLPYVVALIELAEQADLKILTNVVEADPESLSVGMPMEVRFESRGDVTLPQFRPEVTK